MKITIVKVYNKPIFKLLLNVPEYDINDAILIKDNTFLKRYKNFISVYYQKTNNYNIEVTVTFIEKRTCKKFIVNSKKLTVSEL